MNREEAKELLLLYRPGSADAEDPQIAEALWLVKADPQLAAWLAGHCARQNALRDKFRQIAAPAGLLEQIISEHQAQQKSAISRKNKIVAAFAVAVIVFAALMAVPYLLPYLKGPDRSLFRFQSQMAYIATSGYGMNLATNDLSAIQTYFTQNGAPADYQLPSALGKITVTGCAIEDWNGKKVSMLCFRADTPSGANQPNNLWLFVVNRKLVKSAPEIGSLQFTAGELSTAVWVQGDKLYLLGVRGDEAMLRKFL